ncbi:ImmA/IrrE family metallo-endopeptidase [Candidatus Dependentiae bacterium]|nr:ImmA/IrrE family metallo-endopeptidase [Candidatus Dependentiae bacterium]
MISSLDKMKNIGPGDFIKDELEYRGWTQGDLSLILMLDPKHVSLILNNKQHITFDVAQALGKIFGQSTEYWINLDTLFRLGLEKENKKARSAEIRSYIYQYMPIMEMIKKGWIPDFSDTKDLIRIVKKFWGIKALDFKFLDKKLIPSLRKSTAYNQFNLYFTLTWLNMAKKISKKIKVGKYSNRRLKEIIKDFNYYTIESNGVQQFLEDLNQAGIKFLVLPHLQKTYIDGAVYTEGVNKVIVYTGRYNRLDNFWFTMAHELAHVLLHLNKKETFFIDNIKEINTHKESESNAKALSLLKEKAIMNFFRSNTKYISKLKILMCKEKYKVHPSIIVGILQHNDILSRTNLNRFKEKILPKIPKKYDWRNY